MKQYPMPFQVQAESLSGTQTPWSAVASNSKTQVQVSIPPEFDGPGTGLSPEDLYALALQNCFIATFKVFAEKSKLAYDNLMASGQLEVDRNEKGAPWMARFHLKVHLTGVIQKENAQRILEKTSSSCMILNSVNTVKTFEFVVT